MIIHMYYTVELSEWMVSLNIAYLNSEYIMNVETESYKCIYEMYVWIPWKSMEENVCIVCMSFTYCTWKHCVILSCLA